MSKQFGYALLVFCLLIWAIFVFPTLMQVIVYVKANEAVVPDSIEWSVDQIHDELWKPVARFKYTVNGTAYQRKEQFQQGRYRNPYAAEEAIKDFKEKNIKVWYSATNPSEGTLEKFLPVKKIVYSLITFLILLYGAWLFRYVSLNKI